jgi:regulator of cell morphogenesis and NO signaling
MITIEEIENSTVAQLVAQNYRTAEVFKKYGIDFCCGGNKPIAKVCAEKGINREEFENALAVATDEPIAPGQNFAEWPLGFLTEYIVSVHHKYVERNLPLISEFAAKVARVHGAHNPEVVEINKLWQDIAGELTVHMRKEELVLFPFIENLDTSARQGVYNLPNTHIRSLNTPLQVMLGEHESVGEMIKKIEQLSNNYTPPAHACNTYKVLYAKLNEFADNLFMHIHLENNILFPRVVALESRFMN